VFSLLLRGFALGFAVAASPGPIFFLCLRRTLLRGRLYGLISGFGVATADGFYAALAAFGVAALTTAIVSGRQPLALIGGAALAALGIRILLERPHAPDAAPATTAKGLAGAYLSTLGLTITNPATILSFAALAATLGLGVRGGLAQPTLVVVGVLAGSATWWAVLAVMVSRLRARMTPAVVRGISVFSGLAIILLGAFAIYSAVKT
jgi:threonine/homoserine/homoserine lactone efflux protein